MTSTSLVCPLVLTRGSQPCHWQLWAPHILTLLLHTMPALSLLCPTHPSWRAWTIQQGTPDTVLIPPGVTYTSDAKYQGLGQNLNLFLFVPHAGCISRKPLQAWYIVANSLWSRLRHPNSAAFLKFGGWHIVPLLSLASLVLSPFVQASSKLHQWALLAPVLGLSMPSEKGASLWLQPSWGEFCEAESGAGSQIGSISLWASTAAVLLQYMQGLHKACHDIQCNNGSRMTLYLQPRSPSETKILPFPEPASPSAEHCPFLHSSSK